MKKAVINLLVITLSFLFIFQSSLVAFADNEPDWQDITLTQQEFDYVLSQNPNNQIATYASDLIASYSIAVSKSGSNLIVAGKTYGVVSVIKCGFTVVTIKRRTSSTASWTTYKTYEDLYDNDNSYTLSKSLAVPSGYQWRVYCTHYAKKSLLSTQKITNSSNILVV